MTIIKSDATVEREFASLLATSDHYPKYVVSMDDVWQDKYRRDKTPAHCRFSDG